MSGRCQQFELYAAERDQAEGRSLAADELQAYVDALRDSPWFERNFPQVLRVEAYVRPRADRGSVGKWLDGRGAGLVEMDPAHLNELFVMHEVAHVLAEARYGSRAHDPWFVRTYLELVYDQLGSEAYAALRVSLDACGVDYDTDSSVPGGLPL